MPHPVYGPNHWVCVLNPSDTTFENLKPLLKGLTKPGSRPLALRILSTQLVILAVFTAFGRPWLYPLLWLAPWMVFLPQSLRDVPWRFRQWRERLVPKQQATLFFAIWGA